MKPHDKGLERSQFSFREFVYAQPAGGRGHTPDSQRNARRRERLVFIPKPAPIERSTWFSQEAAA